MYTVTVNTSKEYSVLIGKGLLPNLGHYIMSYNHVKQACIVSDRTVYALYGESVTNSLQNISLHVQNFVFPSGESSKNAENYIALINFLAENHFSRSDLIIALGGGVVGDLAGFAAATYLRGINLIQVPTTLLAAVDSSVGGKTAINLHAGKNLAGCFYQPSLVLCDTDIISNLPYEVFQEGCAEVIKYGILYDKNLFSHLAQYGTGFDLEYVISRCVELKRDAVILDEQDTGVRMKLNLGHTVGHAIESLSAYTISHGFAVSVGIATISRWAFHNNLCSPEDYLQIIQILEVFGLPITTHFSAHDISQAALSDKKIKGGNIRLIIPHSIGNCSIHTLPIHALNELIETGLSV